MTKYLVIFLILFSLGCNVNVGSNTSGHSPMAKQGPETWEINCKKMNITSTYYLALPEGLQYTIECPWKFGDPNQAISQEEAMIDAFPLIRYAYEKALYKRSSITKVGSGLMEATRIGVVLSETTGVRTRGYRIGLSITEIQEKLRKE